MSEIPPRIAARVAEMIERVVSAMKDSSTGELEELEAYGRIWRLRAGDDHLSCCLAVADCLALLEETAREMGTSLDDLEELIVRPPEMEFGENLITGFFERWRGISVKRINPMEDIIDSLISELERRRIYVCLEEDVLVISKIVTKTQNE